MIRQLCRNTWINTSEVVVSCEVSFVETDVMAECYSERLMLERNSNSRSLIVLCSALVILSITGDSSRSSEL